MEDPIEKLTVYLCGAHSTGKTTLSRSLQEHPEFSTFRFKDQLDIPRKFIDSNKIGQEQLQDPSFLFAMEKRLIELQYDAEENEINDNDGKYMRFLWDRGAIGAIAYTKAYVGDEEAEKLMNLPHAKTMLRRLKKGTDCLLFIVKPHNETVQTDGVRKDPELKELEKLHEVFTTVLEAQGIPYTEITCLDLQKRTAIVCEAVKSKWPLILQIHDSVNL